MDKYINFVQNFLESKEKALSPIIEYSDDEDDDPNIYIPDNSKLCLNNKLNVNHDYIVDSQVTATNSGNTNQSNLYIHSDNTNNYYHSNNNSNNNSAIIEIISNNYSNSFYDSNIKEMIDYYDIDSESYSQSININN